MSDTRDIAEHVTSLCAGLVALALPAAAGVAPLAVPLVGLAAFGVALRNSSAKRAGERAVAETLAALERAGEFRSEHIAAALDLLKHDERSVSLSPSELSAAALAEDFDDELARKLAEPFTFHADSPVREVLVVACRVSIALLRRDEAFHRGLTQTLLLDMARASGVQLSLLADMNRKLDDLGKQFGTLSAALEKRRGLLRDQLELLAFRFEIGRAFELSDKALLEELEKRAEEYRAYRSHIEAIDERLSSLKAAAREAAARLDFDEVEALLSRVHDLELSVSAATAVVRADNALLRGRLEEAFRILSATADGFAALSQLATAERRIEYAQRFFVYGERHPGPGFELSAKMFRRAAREAGEKKNPILWAQAQNGFGIATQAQAERAGATERTLLYKQAVEAYTAARLTFVSLGHKEGLATTSNNLGCALRWRAMHAARQDGLTLLRQAIAAFVEASATWVAAGDKVNRAICQNNLGLARASLGEWLGGPEGARLVEQAVAEYESALDVRTETERPQEWAMTVSNLANALVVRSRLVSMEEVEQSLTDALTAYYAARRVWTEADAPVQWSASMEDSALAYEALAENPTSRNPQPALTKAEKCLIAALSVLDAEHMPYNHVKAAAALARLRTRLGRLDA